MHGGRRRGTPADRRRAGRVLREPSYAVMSDGTVRDWGVVHCDGSARRSPHSSNSPPSTRCFGERRRAARVRRRRFRLGAQGRRLACGRAAANDYLLGRPSAASHERAADPEAHPGLPKGAVDVVDGHGERRRADRGRFCLDLGTQPQQHPRRSRSRRPARSQRRRPRCRCRPVRRSSTSRWTTPRRPSPRGPTARCWSGAPTSTAAPAPATRRTTSPAPPQIDLGGGKAIAVVQLGVERPRAGARRRTSRRGSARRSTSLPTVADAEIGESTGGSFTVTLSQPAPDDLTVTYTAGRRAGSEPRQWPPVRTTVHAGHGPGRRSRRGRRKVAAQVMSISHGIRLDRRTAIGTVIDDDAAPTVSVGEVDGRRGRHEPGRRTCR